MESPGAPENRFRGNVPAGTLFAMHILSMQTMVRRAASPCLRILILALALSGPPTAWTQDCPKGAGLVVLVGQEDLYLNRPARRASMGDSILKSIVASALTGGSYLVGFAPGYDFGSLVAAPRSLTASFQPGDVAESLGREISSMPAAEDFDLLPPTTRAEDVDEAIWSAACAKVVVVNAQYSLEHTPAGVHLSLIAQVLDVPARRTAEASTVAALEYQSPPMPFEVAEGPASLAAAFERLLADRRAMLVAGFNEAGVEMAGMIASQLRPDASQASGATLAKARGQLQCDGCKKSDRVLKASPSRLWIQPRDEPLVIKSLPLTQ
jgi:hypothetical protein